MEPFGLFNLLKSLLPQAENPEQTPEETPEKKPASATENGAHEFSDTPQNAFLDFVSRHEERKRNIKK